MSVLTDKNILMFVDDIYEDMELWYPKYFLTSHGARVVVAGDDINKEYKGKHGYPCVSDAALNQVNARHFDALVIPGGFAPDKLRRNPKVLEITRDFHEAGKCVAHICHAGWIPISAGIVRDFNCTSTPGIKDDLINAGAKWVNEPVVVDRNMISSRKPDDLPEFCNAILRFLTQS